MTKKNHTKLNHVSWLLKMILNFAKMVTYISTKPSVSHLQSKMLNKTIQENLRKNGCYGCKVYKCQKRCKKR